MNIVVPVKIVPDLVEELDITEDGTALDMTFMRLILNEFDEHAVEQAILLKEEHGGSVTILAPDVEGADDALYSAAAKGADRLIKLAGEFEVGMSNQRLAKAFAAAIETLPADLILSGVQAHDDLDGSVAGLIAAQLGLPYVGYVAGIALTESSCTVKKEYPGGLIAEVEMSLPGVLGIQVAEEPPRYVAISRIRQAMKTSQIEEFPIDIEPDGGVKIAQMFYPERGERAKMILGEADEISTQILGIIQELGVL
jgi:electron transfer flavoprotein beta subunit